jgi:hypothetical protein
MLNETRSITKNIFNREALEDVGISEIEDIVSKYPYFAPARFLLAQKKYPQQHDSEEIITAGLYIHNPLRLNWLLNNKEPENIPQAIVEPTSQAEEKKQPVQSSDDSPIAFQSYHTIDYFASQGIRLQQADLGKDKLGQQLKSFTEWLRSMKKLPTSASGLPVGYEDKNRHHHVMQSAAHSIEAKEILTEAMAQVWAKQGNHEKAISIYEKLSLQNPAKSGYFASKIDQLKAL